MAKRIVAFFVGPLIWLLGYGVMAIGGIFLWDLDVDNYIAIGFLAYISSAMAMYLAMLSMKRIYPNISERITLVLLATFVFLWVGSAVVSAVYFDLSEEFIFRAVSLVMAEIGVVTGWKISFGS